MRRHHHHQSVTKTAVEVHQLPLQPRPSTIGSCPAPNRGQPCPIVDVVCRIFLCLFFFLFLLQTIFNNSLEMMLYLEMILTTIASFNLILFGWFLGVCHFFGWLPHTFTCVEVHPSKLKTDIAVPFIKQWIFVLINDLPTFPLGADIRTNRDLIITYMKAKLMNVTQEGQSNVQHI